MTAMRPLTGALPMAQATLERYDPLKVIPWLSIEVFDNTLREYVLTVVSFALLFGLFTVFRRAVVSRMGQLDDGHLPAIWRFSRELIGSISPLVVAMVSFYLATKHLDLPDIADKVLHFGAVTAVTVQVVKVLSALLSYAVGRYRGGADNPAVRSVNDNVTTLLKTALWVAAVLFLLDNAGYNVSTIIAGLGIGGVAVALAAQAILGDTFSSFAIALDKPFDVGDFINVDTLQGTVEHIGLKTTRVRSSTGELLVFANSDLTKSRIRNYKRMQERRSVFRVVVHPATAPDKLRRVREIIVAAVAAQPDARLDRCHFLQIAETGLAFEVAMSVAKPEYAAYCDVQEAINFAICQALAQSGVALAYNQITAWPELRSGG